MQVRLRWNEWKEKMQSAQEELVGNKEETRKGSK
jgi:hypothetical protein